MRVFGGCLAFLLLAACGGGGGSGGGGGGTPPVQQNRAPVITSAGAASVPENVTGIVYQATATDADGNPVSFSLGGLDAGRFAITSAGALSFTAPPDFEAPADADKNNSYVLEIVATDGSLTTRAALTITVTNLAEGFTVRRAGSGYDDAVQAVAVPGTSSVFVPERGGRIFLLDPDNAAADPRGTLFLTVADISRYNGGGGLTGGILSMVAAPDYAASGIFYVAVANAAGDIEVRRYTRANPAAADPNSADVILRIANRPESTDRLGGWIGFGPDGFLYMTTGHGGNVANPKDPLSLLGKVLRIDVGRDGFPSDPLRDYGIPADNPNLGGRVSEVYAIGLGDPWRASFKGPDLLIGDRNDVPLSQEINLLRPQDKGGNFGFGSGPAGNLEPVLRHGPAKISGRGTVVGGFVYGGTAPQLQGLYIFSDPIRQAIWSVPASSLAQGVTIEESGYGGRPDLPVPDQPSPMVQSFGEDAARNLFMVYSNAVYKIVPF